MLLPEAYVVDRGYVDFARLYVLHEAGVFVSGPSRVDAHRVYSVVPGPASFATRPPGLHPSGLPSMWRRIRFQDPEQPARRCVSDHQQLLSGRGVRLTKAVAGGASSSSSSISGSSIRHVGRTRSDLDCRLETSSSTSRSASTWIRSTLCGRLTLFEKMPCHSDLPSTCGARKQMQRSRQLNLFDFSATLVT